MTIVRVNTASGRLTFSGFDISCTIGRSGACLASHKQEGDGFTPIGTWAIKAALLRADKVDAGGINLPWRWIRDDDGWSDDVRDPSYNRPVRLPRNFSAEHMVRGDDAYDVVIVLGHNDSPPVKGKGSAIFWHVSEGRPTAGCVAIEREDMLRMLPLLRNGDVMEIV